MEEPYSSQDHLTELTQTWVGSILIMGAILFLGLGFMDYHVSPQNFPQFMMYRLVIAAVLIILYYLNQLKRNKLYQYSIAAVGAILSGVTVEIAILQSGGQNSTYYAAMIILAISCLGFAPMNMTLSFLLVATVYSIYALPIILTEKITSGVFISNNAFLIATFVIGLLLRYNHQKLLVSEMRLRAELSEDKRKLELYSRSLKNQVTETAGALAITEQKYRALFDNANDGIAVMDRFGNITDVNLRFCELHGFGSDSVRGTNFRLLEIERGRGEIDDRLKRILNGESLVYEAEHYRRDGSRVLLEISSRAIDIGGVPHVQSFYRDITEKMKLREQVIQSQKMESMGALAGGMAHDFQNVLTAIVAHTAVLRRHVNTDDFGKRRIKTIEDAARRTGQMISKLLSFARKESLQLIPTGLNEVARDSVELFGRGLMDQNIKIQLMLDPNIPLITGDAIHLEQVITNLAMNGRDAMPGGGTITISTSKREITADSSQPSPFLKPGAYVALSVRDTGSGIPPDIMDRIFDPFFTTKPSDKGTGLGLAMVYGIVKSHRGEIRVESKEGEGTTFEIYLPVLDQAPLPAVVSPVSAGPSGHKECIFIVDDEKDILSSMQATLEVNGYKVYTADNAELALKLFERIAGEIHVVIADIVMPVMSGAELSSIFKDRKPGLKVIGVSGYKSGEILKDAPHIDCLLNKPFNQEMLIETICSVLKSGQKGFAAEA